ncbi:efflux RND transporter periplasmic adaptor subunit [Nevskia soli]|jgi:cobalt-zinc-cadmium efflux system membrane fusion protein|uniref:efflux RND transporter periplasmic adaptor subunit n=1 Tax=Nevskia soli TaxID=418856 RepID=UPI0015D7016F|nr:efflux RND transporter periplasmic adaptor subunit [Nevskia soli]
MKLQIASFAALVLFLGACASPKKDDPAAEAPPAAKVVNEQDVNVIAVEDPSKFPLATVGKIDESTTLNATGSVTPDVSRQVPAISLASGRVVEIHARIGDFVHKGQLLMKVQSSDVSDAFSDYQKAVADERLARVQLDRATDLKEKGAIAQKDLEVAQNAEEDAKTTLAAALDKLRVLGADPDHPSALVDVRAPITGVITEQNITNAGGVKTLDNSPNLFTISDLAEVWILCDVYENDLKDIHMGEFADIHIDAYPNLILKGRVSDIGPVLDPNIRTAKVRLQVANPGVLRIGMFVTATFHSLRKHELAVAPTAAVLHLHDRDWVYVSDGSKQFRRVNVDAGKILADNMQEIMSGVTPGQQVVANALVLQNTVEQ